MKIAMNAVLVNEHCAPIKSETRDESGTVTKVDVYTLGALCSTVLLNGGWENVDATEKQSRFALWMKIRGADEVDLSTTEIAHLQDLVGASASPLVLGQASELLEGRPNPLAVEVRKPAE
jgi:hypothetical protein